MKCWYKGKCNREENNCVESCLRYNNMKILINNSNLPLELQYPKILDADKYDQKLFDTLNYLKSNISSLVNEGKSIYLWSSITGNGKTTWACKLLLNYFNQIWFLSQLKCRGVYLYIPTLLTALKTQFLNDKGTGDYISSIKNADLVVFDELGVGKLSDFDRNNLLDIIEYRLTNKKSTIFTSNLSQRQLIEMFGDRLTSRIYNSSIVLEFRGRDRRGEV